MAGIGRRDIHEHFKVMEHMQVPGIDMRLTLKYTLKEWGGRGVD